MPNLKDLKLKVCGLHYNIDEVVALHPDYAGLIFYGPSPRYVGKHLIADQLQRLPASVKKVGVFVNQALGEVLSTVREFDLQYVQLHGKESLGYCKRLHAEGVRIIKVFTGNEKQDKCLLDQYAPYIDFYLFDTRLEKFGGNGKTFVWTNLENLDLQKPIILSGGIALENVDRIEALERVNIHAIDVNSKFEISPGLKNIELLKSLMDRMKSVLNNH